MPSTFTTVPTYDNLFEKIQVYLNRFDEDTSGAIPFFINAAEKTILRNLRMPSLEKIVTFNLAETSDSPEEGWISMPYDFLEMKNVWTMCDGKEFILKRMSFENILRASLGETPDEPIWGVTADRLYVRGVEEDQQIYMTYYADVPELSEETQGNVLLDLAPDAFLFLAVGEGFRFLMEEQKADYWERQGTQRLNQIMTQVKQADYSGSAAEILEPVNSNLGVYI